MAELNCIHGMSIKQTCRNCFGERVFPYSVLKAEFDKLKASLAKMYYWAEQDIVELRHSDEFELDLATAKDLLNTHDSGSRSGH